MQQLADELYTKKAVKTGHNGVFSMTLCDTVNWLSTGAAASVVWRNSRMNFSSPLPIQRPNFGRSIPKSYKTNRDHDADPAVSAIGTIESCEKYWQGKQGGKCDPDSHEYFHPAVHAEMSLEASALIIGRKVPKK